MSNHERALVMLHSVSTQMNPYLFDGVADLMVRFALEHCNEEVERRREAEAKLATALVTSVVQDEVTAAGMATAEAYRKWIYETDPSGVPPREAVEVYRLALEARKQL